MLRSDGKFACAVCKHAEDLAFEECPACGSQSPLSPLYFEEVMSFEETDPAVFQKIGAIVRKTAMPGTGVQTLAWWDGALEKHLVPHFPNHIKRKAFVQALLDTLEIEWT